MSTLEQLLAALDVESDHIAAHSLGSIVAQHFALRNSTKVNSLALFGPLPAPPDPARAALATRATLALTGAGGMQQLVDAIVKGATSEQTKSQQPAVVALFGENDGPGVGLGIVVLEDRSRQLLGVRVVVATDAPPDRNCLTGFDRECLGRPVWSTTTKVRSWPTAARRRDTLRRPTGAPRPSTVGRPVLRAKSDLSLFGDFQGVVTLMPRYLIVKVEDALEIAEQTEL